MNIVADFDSWRAPPAPPVVARVLVSKDIIAQTAFDHGISVPRMLSRSRQPCVAHARFDAMSRLRSVRRPDGKPRFSLPAIGAMFGRDHTTVLNGLRRWAEINAPALEAAE